MLQAAEVASRIQQKKEMGCKTLDVFHADQGSGNENKVLRTLGGGSVNLSGSYLNIYFTILSSVHIRLKFS